MLLRKHDRGNVETEAKRKTVQRIGEICCVEMLGAPTKSKILFQYFEILK